MLLQNDTLEKRWRLLEPSIKIYGPDDDVPRPTMIMFHGCGGVGPHNTLYAEAATATGIRIFLVDSFGARGWGRTFAVSMICTGMVLQGYERSGDVLAAVWGIRQRPDVDATNLMLFGESHGGWSIMDLMTEKLTRPGEARLENPDPKWLDGVRALFFIYPYINFPARTNFNSWHYKPRVFTVAAELDHLTPYAHTIKTMERLNAEGVPTQTLSLRATHAFDADEFSGGLMRYDEAATKASIQALLGYIDSVFGSVAQPV